MLAEMEARNTGKPIVEAEYDIADVATCLSYEVGMFGGTLSFIGLGLVLVAIGWLYQRILFRRRAAPQEAAL